MNVQSEVYIVLSELLRDRERCECTDESRVL